MSSEMDSGKWESLISCMLKQWGAPGLAVSILNENQTIYSDGIGYRNIEKNLEMTKDTMHPIASCSKSFTSTAIAMLVDEGKLNWSTPVAEYLPQFKMKDPIASRLVTITDLLSHRTGLPRHDMVWVDNLFKYDQILERLQYCNLTFLAAAIVVEKLSGKRFADFISKRVFKPLGMNDSNFSVDAMRKTENYATPYTIDYKANEFNLIECEYVVYDSLTGAGSINASTNDVGKWLRFHLSDGRVGNKQLVSPENLKVTYTPGLDATGCPESMKTILSRIYPEQTWFNMDSWALGWMNQIYRGHKIISHGGILDGSRSLMVFDPVKGIGVNVIVNQSDTFVASAVSYAILDRLLGLDPVNWREVFEPIEENLHIVIRDSGKHSQLLRKKNTSPNHNLEDYVGKYYHPGYGVLEAILTDGALRAKHGTAEYPLEHYHYDTFQYAINRWEFRELLTFHMDVYGDISGVTIKLEEKLPPIMFRRLPDESMMSPKFLKKLTGRYMLAGQVVEISLNANNSLRFTPTGQVSMQLEAVKNTRFKSKDSDIFTITFRGDESGKINEFIFVSFGEAILAKRME